MLKKFGIGLGIFLVSLYVLFLVVPFFINGIANSYADTISEMVEKSSGFKVKLENIRVLTTPKLTVGGGVGHIEVALPNNETFLTADNAGGKLSLLPLLVRKIELDVIGAENVNVNLKVKKDGKFLIEDFIPEAEASDNESEQPVDNTGIPFGFKLSNHLPNIIVKNYNISFIDMPTDKTYSLFGNRASISDFILNKKIKVMADGKFMLEDKTQFNFDIKLLNKIMPDMDLNELVFNSQPSETQAEPMQPFNIIDVFKMIYKNQFTADLDGNLVIFGSLEDVNFDGIMNISNLGLAVDGKKLPSSNIDLKFKGNKINMYTKLYTAEKELTEVIGNFKTGKHPNIDLNCKSNLQFKSFIDMVDSIAKTFGFKDLDTLSMTGGIDADFNIKSNLKRVESSGYLKIPNASLSYKLYNLIVKNINADIDFANNAINIKNAGFLVANQPLKINGTISNVVDVNIIADRLKVKELLIAAGQGVLLQENSVNDGTLTLNANIKGKLDKILPNISLNIDNLVIKNIPSGVSFAVPAFKVLCDMDNINIKDSYVLLDNTRFDISGKISDYLTNTIKLDIFAKGPGEAELKGEVVNAQKLNLNLSTLKTISMEIPTLKKSNIKANANINISGNAMNPMLKGTVSVPSLTIPDMLVSMDNLEILLNGPVVKGNGTLKKLKSGGIIAENISSDFNLADNIFYLKNIKGDAFSGKINGEISYNILNGHIGVDFNGSGMDAEKAVEGAVGIKNALTGKLGFTAKVTLFGTTDIEMMKNLKGKVNFEILDGSFGNIGRLENFLSASNISSNSVLKSAVASISLLPAIKDTAQYKVISGNLSFANGWANINPIKTSGLSMAYYITGKYNLLNGTANVVILGRLSAEVVKLLGPLGDLSVDKLTSFIPKFGNLTANIVNAMTTDPKGEDVSSIPELSSGNKNYKDFKVQFNGGIESNSSVKSFKWLSKCDTSAIQSVSIKEQVETTKSVVKETYQKKTQEFTEKLQQQREQATQAKQDFQNAKEGLKNLKNLLK